MRLLVFGYLLWLKCLCVILSVVALPSVTGLQLLDVTHSTMKVAWDRVEGASGYLLLYGPLIEDGQLNEKEVLKQKYCKSMNYSAYTLHLLVSSVMIL